MPFFIPGIRSLWSRGRSGARGGVDAAAGDTAERSTAAAQPDRAAGAEGARSAEGAAPDAGPGRPGAVAAKPRRTARTLGREAGALLLIATGLYCALALASFEADPLRPSLTGANWVGPVGEVFSRWSVRGAGVVAWLVPLDLALLARPLLRDRRIELPLARLGGDALIAVVCASLVHIAWPAAYAFGRMPLGGVVGELFGAVLRGLFSTVGSFLIGSTLVALILVQRSAFSFIAAAQRTRHGVAVLRRGADRSAGALSAAWARARALERQRREERLRAAEPLIATADRADAIIAAFADEGDGVGVAPAAQRPRDADSAAAGDAAVQIEMAPPARMGSTRIATRGVAEAASAVGRAAIGASARSAGAVPLSEATTPSLGEVEVRPAPAGEQPPEGESSPLGGRAEAACRSRSRQRAAASAQSEPTIVDTSEAAKTRKSKRRRLRKSASRFSLPSPSLLDPSVVDAAGHDPDKLKATAKLLEKVLLDYRVNGQVQEIHPGPTVTTFEVSPAPGTKVSKVAGLADDLALGLSRKVRIVAPIPGKNRIGFEVPNPTRIPVNLRELVDSQGFMDVKAPLPCVLGRDIIGRPFFADLASMPHVIVAGATGAGKSVGLNVMLVSLLCRRTPEEMRLLMIDPKVVELAPFDGIPHLLLPVVTDMKQASTALRWTVDEMERRYQKFADAGTRNIVTYNRWVRRVQRGEVPAPRGPAQLSAIAPDGQQLVLPAAKDGSDAEPPTKLPYIVVVVEEFADLMMQQGKEVEASVARLAQKARAAGIHVILATQRPSVDVITGIIKANFPTRIAYRVAQKVDSRTILDDQGAEHLLGKGDMLIKLNGTSDVRRVQCPFVAEDEVQRVTDALRAQGEPDYDESILEAGQDDEAATDRGDAESDPLYDQAVRIVADTQKCSTSWIQRKLGIGYNRAAKIVETMERLGIVGPPNGSKPREILVTAH